MNIRRARAEIGEMCLMVIVPLCVFAVSIAGPIFLFRALWLVVESSQNHLSIDVAQIALFAGLGLLLHKVNKELYSVLVNECQRRR